MLSIRTFKCSTVSGSDCLVQRGLTQGRETYVEPGDFCFLALFSLRSGMNQTTGVSDGSSDTETPGTHGTDPNHSPVNLTYVKSHMPTNISHIINVKM